MSQNEMLLGWLRAGRTITRLEAARRFMVWNLPARIHELRKRHPIVTEMVDNGNVRYARYRLEVSDD